jgi:serine/threonine protein kinase
MGGAPNLPVVIGGRYRPIRLIAKGGMGAVYEVEHARTGEHLALKVLLSGVGAPPEDLERFKREARASARVKSDHVVRVTDADVAPELDGAPFLVMELLEGSDLEREATSSHLDAATVVGWLRQVAVAIDKAHRLGIVHRDLKPENLFLTTLEDRPPIIKVLDFGISKLAGEGTTASGQIIGTPEYMAPEQAASSASVTPATDRFTLGLVAYRLLAGESYFSGDPINVLAKLLHEPMRLPSERHPGLGAAFDAWFARACHRDPERRFASAAEQVEALSVALGLSPQEAGPGAMRPAARAPSYASNRPRTAGKRRLIGAAVALVLAGGAIAALLVRRPERIDVRVPSASSVVTPPAPAPPPVSVVVAPTVPAPVPQVSRPRPKARPKSDRVPALTGPPPIEAQPTTDPFADQK